MKSAQKTKRPNGKANKNRADRKSNKKAKLKRSKKEAKKSPAKRKSNPFHFLKIDEHSDC